MRTTIQASTSSREPIQRFNERWMNHTESTKRRLSHEVDVRERSLAVSRCTTAIVALLRSFAWGEQPRGRESGRYFERDDSQYESSQLDAADRVGGRTAQSTVLESTQAGRQTGAASSDGRGTRRAGGGEGEADGD
ncbi:MAG: hypothetical protein FD120_2800, partial [Gammaproteobacteria bacterium]